MDKENLNNEQAMKELPPEVKAILEADQENRKKLAEIFSQCWDDAEFKKRFMEHPEEVMDEYDVVYDKSKDLVILDTKPRTMTYVLPYENVRQTVGAIGKAFEEFASKGEDSRKILPDGWSMEFIQNTIDTNYIVIPVNPETLSPEELEMINGGFLVFALVFIFHLGVIATVIVAGAAILAVAAAIAAGGVVFVGGIAQSYGVAVTHAVTTTTTYTTS